MSANHTKHKQQYKSQQPPLSKSIFFFPYISSKAIHPAPLDMDHTPSLSRSPISPPNSYCPSEVSSLGYPSPGLISEQYRVSSLYGIESFCSMAPNPDSDIPLFALGTASQSGWTHRTTARALSTPCGPPTTLSAEYEPFGSFGPTAPTVYGPGIYHEAQQTRRATPVVGSPSPAGSTSHSPAMPVPRSPLSFPVVSTGTSRSLMATHHHGEIDAFIAPYDRVANASPFPPPRGVHLPYQIEPTRVYPTGGGVVGSNNFTSSGPTAIWSHTASTADQLYQTPGGHQQQPPGAAQERQFHSTRVRKQPRRLTTKEEANFQCEVKGCGKLFSRSYNYKAHMETHDEKREYPFPCQVPDCSKRFVRKTDLQRHHQSVHMKERNHRCDYCGRLFARKDTLRR
jgi:hypothetical protein